MNHPHFKLSGLPLAGEPLAYRECGLDDVVLLNGFHRETIEGEEFISIDHVEELWRAIGLWLVLRRKTLQPKDVRFLRLHADLTQAELAEILRVSDQSVARWEKGQTEIPGPAELGIRIAFLASPAAGEQGRAVLARILDLVKELNAQGTDAPSSFPLRQPTWEEMPLAA